MAMLLPGPFSWARKVLGILKSNVFPSQIALAFSLGIFAGLPPMGLHVILPMTLALLLRTSFRAFLISMGLFKLISLAVAPVSYAVGRWILDADRGLDGFWRWLFHLPVLAPMGYGRYLLLGSLVLAIGISIPVFLGVRWLVTTYRTRLAEWVSTWKSAHWLKRRRGMAALRWLVAGGEAKYAISPRPRGIFRVVRKGMLIGVPLLYGIAYLVAAVVVPFFAGTIFTSTASWIVGSEAATETARFSLFNGRLTMEGFSVQDPENEAENLLVVPEVTLDVGMLSLLRKQVVFDEVVIGDVSLHVVREEDGTLNLDAAAPARGAAEYVEWAAQYADQVDWLGLLRRFGRALGEFRLPPRVDSYAPYRDGRSLPPYEPPFAVRRLEIGRLLLSLEDRYAGGGGLPAITLLEVEVSNLAFPAELRRGPMEIRLRGEVGAPSGGEFELRASFGFAEGEPASEFEIAWRRIDLATWASLASETLPVGISSGTATLDGRVRIEGNATSGAFSILLENLRLVARDGRPLFGLSADMSARVVEGINQYASELPVVLSVPVDGTASSPVLKWEPALLDVARQGLLMLGRRELAGTVDELTSRIEALGGPGSAGLSPDYATLQQETQRLAEDLIQDAAGGAWPVLFPAPEDGEQGSSPAPLSELLRRLFSPESRPEAGTVMPQK